MNTSHTRAMVLVCIVAALNCASVGYDQSMMSSHNILSAFQTKFGLDSNLKGLLTAVQNLGGIVADIFAGVLVDRYGRKGGILIASVIVLLACVLHATATTKAQFFVGRVLVGIAKAISFPSRLDGSCREIATRKRSTCWPSSTATVTRAIRWSLQNTVKSKRLFPSSRRTKKDQFAINIGQNCVAFAAALVAVLACMAGLNAAQTDNAARRNGVIAMVFLFPVGYSSTWTPLSFSYCAEVLNFTIRAKGMGFYAIFTSATGFFNQYVIPLGLSGIDWRFYIVGECWNVFMAVVIAFTNLETKGLTPEQIDQRFEGVPRDQLIDVVEAYDGGKPISEKAGGRASRDGGGGSASPCIEGSQRINGRYTHSRDLMPLNHTR
ncbi:MFS general substrate transporter [Bimuria novae-zelandiae CBS 107.79]|uniref:MFS general substrate transporter n=1 Tax=Bimuria novae-zelandiae CBS 107.79 TaxID=1447943 RepID=A0A6A5VBC0_9PLEO|nr:MFS general substrate transporter [Bimuria novae-zelandiae CBS 107.79]